MSNRDTIDEVVALSVHQSQLDLVTQHDVLGWSRLKYTFRS
jgi:hypothetical protein